MSADLRAIVDTIIGSLTQGEVSNPEFAGKQAQLLCVFRKILGPSFGRLDYVNVCPKIVLMILSIDFTSMLTSQLVASCVRAKCFKIVLNHESFVILIVDHCFCWNLGTLVT